MAGLVQELELSMHLVLDGRGLCRLLWLGPLQGSEALRQHLPQAPRRRSGGWRLLSCPFSRSGLHQDLAEAVIALDLNPISWLRFAPVPSRDGLRSAELLLPDRHRSAGWRTLEQGDLRILCQQDRNPGDITTQEPSPTSAGPAIEPVLLLTLTTADAGRSERELAELEGLVRSAGAQPVAVVTQRAGSANPQTLWGTGKLQEAALEVRRHGASLVVTDRELTPVQARNLERLLACPVSDRSELILDIFAQRAGSAAGRLQVELAQLRYRLPRLLGRGRSLSRQGGGIGTRGPGETQLEKDRRAISRRIDRLLRDQQQLQEHRSRLRDQRRGLPRVALVGYTNAGKSSLLNALTGAGVLVENALFATLEPTTRRGQFADGRPFVLTDTVGFVRHLPTQLVEAFRSTLEEVVGAELLVHVVDGSDVNPLAQINAVRQVVNEVVAEYGIAPPPELLVVNKIDAADGLTLAHLRRALPDAVFVSARTGDGLGRLQSRMAELVEPRDTVVDVTIPYSRGELVNRIHAEGRVDAVEHTEAGTRIKGRVPMSLASGLADFATF